MRNLSAVDENEIEELLEEQSENDEDHDYLAYS